MIKTLIEDDNTKIAVFFGTNDSSDGKEGSSDNDNIGFMNKDIYSDDEFSF
jgi:hypothetical protein